MEKGSSFEKRRLITIIIYQNFHSTNWALWLVDSWSCASDQMQMYPYRDTIAQLLPARQVQQHMIAI